MRYEISFDPGAFRELGRLPEAARSKLAAVIARLADEPRPPGCTKMSGADAYRVRVGDYRAIYAIRDDRLVILVVKVGHRSDVYKDLALVRRRLGE